MSDDHSPANMKKDFFWFEICMCVCVCVCEKGGKREGPLSLDKEVLRGGWLVSSDWKRKLEVE